MASDDSRLRIERVDGIVKVSFVDRNILDDANIQQIGDEITSIIENEDAPKLLISFANVDHLSSAALGTLITIHNRLKEEGGQLRLSDIDPQIYEVFEITRLHKLFDIHDTSESAMESFS